MSETPKRVLNPPPVEPVRYQTNFINTAVCELKFPTLLQLETTPPRAFQGKIRRDYPYYEPQIVEQIAGEEITRENRYLFRSKDRHWTVSVKSSSVSLETDKYYDFEDFFQKLVGVLDSASDMIDSDFFTRVGLRYINWVPIEQHDPKGWIRDDLVQSITGGVLGTISGFAARIQGTMANGQFTIRHGLKQESAQGAPPGGRYYLLDFDYFAENVEADAVRELVRDFNKTNFALFRWCLGSKALDKLGPGKPKT